MIDTNDMEIGYHIVGPGQAGHFKSDWYHNQMNDWVGGGYHVTEMNAERGMELTLTP